jgi:hypothetical protein
LHRASLKELDKLMHRFGEGVSAFVLVAADAADGEPWDDSAFWAAARAIPHTTVVADRDGREAALFAAKTSGFTVLFDGSGHRAFAGGITPGRGHEGDSLGQQRIIALLSGTTPDRTDSPVFGCHLEDPQ